MKSQAINYLPFDQIPIEDHQLTVYYQSVDQIIQPVLANVLQQYNQMAGTNYKELNDDMVAILDHDAIQSVDDLKSIAWDLQQHALSQEQIYQEIIPTISRYYSENANVVINDEEFSDYRQSYRNALVDEAEQAEMSFRTYVLELYGRLDEDANLEDQIAQQARDDFIFKLVADDYYKRLGLLTDRETYERLIHQSVLNRQADEIALRDQFPYEQFKQTAGQMKLIDDINAYYYPRIKFSLKRKD